MGLVLARFLVIEYQWGCGPSSQRLAIFKIYDQSNVSAEILSKLLLSKLVQYYV